MLNALVGPVDIPAAAVLIAFFIGCGIVVTTFLTVHSSRQDISNKFELAKIAQAAETQVRLESNRREFERDLAKIAANREVEIRRIDTGMLEGTKVAEDSRKKSDYDRDG